MSCNKPREPREKFRGAFLNESCGWLVMPSWRWKILNRRLFDLLMSPSWKRVSYFNRTISRWNATRSKQQTRRSEVYILLKVQEGIIFKFLGVCLFIFFVYICVHWFFNSKKSIFNIRLYYFFVSPLQFELLKPLRCMRAIVYIFAFLHRPCKCKIYNNTLHCVLCTRPH